MGKKANKRRRRWKAFSVLRIIALLLMYGTCAGIGALYSMYTEINADLPIDLRAALDYRPPQATIVYARDGEPIGRFFLQKRYKVGLERIPEHVEVVLHGVDDSGESCNRGRAYCHHPLLNRGIIPATF